MPEFHAHTPNLARMYDYMLGGTDNYAIDREAIDRLAALIPQAVPLARANRAFLQRAVRYLVDTGIRQFLDLGSGLPTQGNVHEVAPEAKVVYVDRDPVVATHARALLEQAGRAVFVQADLLDPDEVLAQAARFLDLNEPVGVLLVSILHFLPDARDPGKMVTRLREAVAPGSHLVLTHATSRGRFDEGTAALYRPTSAGAGTDRTPREIRAFFGDFELVEPGLVHAPDWRPDRPRLVSEPSLPSYLLVGVGQKHS
ncbi:SAM-dependent methyltransferase [Nonomuraea sp. NPDC049269]|uniref:SAM-dependent methyltransferase n=1 Tax=Nonomuraea sp. NPDC049269 TaxID=3364349 RepID=UPI003714ECDA